MLRWIPQKRYHRQMKYSITIIEHGPNITTLPNITLLLSHHRITKHYRITKVAAVIAG